MQNLRNSSLVLAVALATSASASAAEMNRLYIGAGLAIVNNDVSYSFGHNDGSPPSVDWTYSASSNENTFSPTIQMGYQFNDYLALEGRYWIGTEKEFTLTRVDSRNDATVDRSASTETSSFGVFLKPMLPVSEGFSLYGLIGYGATEASISANVDSEFEGFKDSEAGLQWGFGANLDLTESVSVFADYVNFSNVDFSSDSIAGTYNFEQNHKVVPYAINVGISVSF